MKSKTKQRRAGKAGAKARASKGRRAAKAPATARSWDLAIALLWTLFWLVPLVHAGALGDSFRLPKQLVTETLALASLAALAWRLHAVERLDLRAVWRVPALRAVVPILMIATAGWMWTAHPVVVRAPLASLWIALACLVGWQLGLRINELRRLLRGLIVPATVLAVIAVLDYHGIITGFALRGAVDERFAVTSLAGGPFDLGAYLVLPILIAQAVLWRRERDRRFWLWLVSLAFCLYAVALTQTLTVLVAATVGSLVLWLRLVPWRRSKVLLPAVAGALVATVALVLVVAPLRERVGKKIQYVQSGDVDRLLTGRLDPWKAAWWMLREHPLSGVGHGAYRAEFANAKLALRDEGVRFYRYQHQTHFDNAHNEFLEAGASWGWPGLVALGWGIWLLIAAGRRAGCGRGQGRAAADVEDVRDPALDSPADDAARRDAAVALAGLVALAILAATYFPLHLRLVSYPYLLLIAAVFRADPARTNAPLDGREVAP